MDKKNINEIFSSEEQSLLEVINSSYLSLEDIKWLKSKRWFKRFLKIYAKELKKRYKDKPVIQKKFKTPKDEEIEVLDFTRNINIPSKEVIEILDFTKTINIADVKDITCATEDAKKKVKKEKTIWSFMIIISLFALVVLIVILSNWYLENKKTKEIIETVYEAADVREITTTTLKQTTTKVPTLYDKYVNMSILDVDFDNLKTINMDTAGWIKVNGTKINYPFVKSSDNEYYLKHSFDKSSNKKGWVYLDYRNDIENLSKNTILYAHGLVNNQMFGSMRTTLKPSWYKNSNNHIIKIATPKGNQMWQVFSVYKIEPESYYITVNFDSDVAYSKFIEIIKQRSIYDFNVDINSSDKVLTLSSCYDDKRRMVLHAKLIN